MMTVELTDSKTQLYGKRKSKQDSSKGKSQFEIVEEKPELISKKEKHVEFESQPDISLDICFESDTVIAPGCSCYFRQCVKQCVCRKYFPPKSRGIK